ncbi:MAG: zf-HC2 domain-containing protein [Calditrichaeota bacterium]|nr:MAG: zf-HC2 domain-containing protein [Calditrichota bacterium]
MIGCKKYHKFFVLALYDELTEEKNNALQAHLQSCEKCQREFQQMQTTLGVMNERQRPEPEDAFWDGFWGDVQVKLQQETKPQHASLISWPRLKVSTKKLLRPRTVLQFGAAVSFMIIGFFLGKIYFTNNSQIQNQGLFLNDSATFPIELQRQTSAYLEQTNLLLLGISNFDTKNEDPFILDLQDKKGYSRQLARQAAVLKPGLSDAKETRLLGLISELELILLQLANLDEKDDIPAIEFVQSAIDRRSILLKINLEKIRNKNNSFPSSKKKNENIPSSL